MRAARLNLNLHPFGRSAHSRVMVARLFHYIIDASVIVVGIAVIEDQFLRGAFHPWVGRCTPATMPPAAFPGGVLFRRILRLVRWRVAAATEAVDISAYSARDGSV